MLPSRFGYALGPVLSKGEGMVLVWLQTGSAVTGMIAAVLWFCSAAAKAPPMTYEGSERLKAFLDNASRLNRRAAGMTAISVLLSAGTTLFSAVGGH
jgi:hypothetical protein